MSDSTSPLLQLTLSRLREFYREPGAVFWVFGFPLILAIGLGIAFRNRPPDLPRVGVVEGSGFTEDVLGQAEGVAVELGTAEEMQTALRRGKIDILVLAEGEGVTYRYDPLRPESRVARLVVDDLIQIGRGRSDPVETQDSEVSEAGARYIDFLLPGLIGLNLMGSSMWGIGYSIALNRKRRLLKRFAATPMRRTHFLLAYFFSRSVFLVFEVTALLIIGRLIFDVSVAGSFLAVGALAVLGSACFAGISLVIASRVQSIEAAGGWMNAVMLPMWLLSGSFFSYERFPEFLHPVIRALPLTAINDAMRAVINEGAVLASTWSQMMILIFWTLFTFVLALKIFRWQ